MTPQVSAEGAFNSLTIVGWPRRWIFLLLLAACAPAAAADGNRLAYLDDPCDPYYVGRGFPRLTTPQWVGEEGVEAVVVLAIDDMRETAKYEAYLRPILDRLKEIDGRAAVSIMTCRADPDDPQLAAWLKEGVSIEVHTYDHPCPCLQGGDLEAARRTYEECVDLMARIPGNRPVAFRMPCCDSKNTPTPRFWTEIFNRRTAAGNFLSIDSSVFNIFTPGDESLPRDIARDDSGGDRFRKYLPFPSFVNTIEDYPYPYVIGGLCWEFPCVVPSDWEAQNLHRPNNPATVGDWKAALDATVIKQGVFNMVFHPHGWIRSEQIVELIDYSHETYGRKVKFLTFREALDRINENLLAGEPLRNGAGEDNGVRILDVNADGFIDVAIANERRQATRVWRPETGDWQETSFPCETMASPPADKRTARVRFGILVGGEGACLIDERDAGRCYRFENGSWEEFSPPGWEAGGQAPPGLVLRDLDGDGSCEIIRSREGGATVYAFQEKRRRWAPLPFSLPPGAELADERGRDMGLRFRDIDDDGDLDVIFSNAQRYGLYLFDSLDSGWNRKIMAGPREGADAIPMIVRGDTHNGAWFHSGRLWVQNEDTARLADGVDRFSFAEAISAAPPPEN